MLVKSPFFKKHRKMVIFLIVLLILIIGGVIFLKTRKKSSFAKEMFETATEYATVTSGDITTLIKGSGAIESSNSKNINSEVSAKVQSVNIKVGDRVKEGDVLFVLDSSELDFWSAPEWRIVGLKLVPEHPIPVITPKLKRNKYTSFI